jgi:DNA-binding response OmpR family regulator
VNVLKRILIVDDEPFILALLKETLEELQEEGVELLAACDGLEAWKLIQAQRPGLVLLDVMMPELSGYEVCRRIKTSPELSDTCVIMLTAKGQQVDREQGLKVGCDEYVTKPFDPDYVVERARKALQLGETSLNL